MRTAMISILAGVTSTALLGCASPQAGPLRSITVHGSASISVEPDAFLLDIEIEQSAAEIEAAQRLVSEISGRVLAAVRQFNLDPERSHTTAFELRPYEVWEDKRLVSKGFRASQDLHFHLTDLTQAEAFLIAVLKTGVTEVKPEFISSKEVDLWPEARAEALRDARDRAAQMAAVLGQRLGPPLEIVNLDELTYSMRSGWGQSIFGQGQASDDDPPSMFQNRLNWIPPTCVEVSAEVGVKFALESP